MRWLGLLLGLAVIAAWMTGSHVMMANGIIRERSLWDHLWGAVIAGGAIGIIVGGLGQRSRGGNPPENGDETPD